MEISQLLRSLGLDYPYHVNNQNVYSPENFGLLSEEVYTGKNLTNDKTNGNETEFYGIGIREPYPSEQEYFKKNPNVAGMASEDDKIVLNPFSKLSDNERQSVIMNEAARIYMRSGAIPEPNFLLTTDQQKAFANYSKDPKDRAATVAARILSGDPSALKPTEKQLEYVKELRKLMGLR